MKKALVKDSIKEIKNTYKRFLSILLMAFLGVGFFAGMRAASPDMVNTIDKYYKENQVYDIQVLSTLGLTNKDIEAIEKIEGVKTVIGTYETDGKLEIENKEVIAKIMCVEDINRPILLEGEMPKSKYECVVEEKFLKNNQKNIGDTIEIEVEDNSYLYEKQLTIVGTVKSPLYISRDRGTSSLGSGKIDYYIYITKENIQEKEVYTSLYIKINDSNKYTTSTKQYEDEIASVKSKIEAIKVERQNARQEQLVNLANQKLEEKKEELRKQEEKAQKEMQEAQQKLNKGKSEIEKSIKQVNNGKKEAENQFKNANKQLQEAQKIIEENEKQFEIKMQEANEQMETFKLQKQNMQTQLNTVITNLESLKKQYEQIKDNANISEKQKQEILEQIQKLEQAKNDLQDGINKIDIAIIKGSQELEKAKNEIQVAKKELEQNKQEYETKKKTTQEQLKQAEQEIKSSQKELQKAEEQLIDSKQQFTEKMEEANKEIKKAEDEILEIEPPKWYILDRYGNSGYNSFVQDTKSVANIANIFPIVFFVVAALISLTSMTRMVEEQRTEIGTLKALGYSKMQIASKYILYSSLACLFGGIFGMCVGLKLLPSIVWKMYQMMYEITNIQISFDWVAGGIGLLLISICIIGATIYSVLKELVHTPASLMRPKAPKMGKRVLLEKIPFIWKHLSFSKKVTVRNIFRYKKRFLMTIIGILGCTSLIIVGFGLRDSIRSIMPSQFEKVFNYDMQIALKDKIEVEQKQNYIESLEKNEQINQLVETYMKSSTASNTDKAEEVQIMIPKEESKLDGIIHLVDLKTNKKVEWKENEVYVTDKLAQLLNIKPGDTITLKDSEENEVKVKVSHIVENYIYHYIYMPKETYENLYGKQYETNMLFVKNEELTENQEEKFVSEIMEQNEVASVNRISTVMDMMNDTMKSLDYVVIILIVSAGLLAFVVLYNLANVNISERIRELATIKVLGFYDKEVYYYVTRETIILTAIGIILGWIGGYFLNYFIIGTCEINLLRFPKIVQPMSYLFATGITIIFTMIVNLVTYFALKKIDMIESLKSVE